MQRHLLALIGTGLLLACGACADETVVHYQEPALKPSESALLKARWDTCIVLIDGAPLQSAETPMIADGKNIAAPLYGFNSVKVTPGDHELLVLENLSSKNETASDPSDMFMDPEWLFNPGHIGREHERTRYKFTFHCEAGHVYKFAPANLYNSVLQIMDVNTGQTLSIDNNEPEAEEL